jgi:hypothetical protein
MLVNSSNSFPHFLHLNSYVGIDYYNSREVKVKNFYWKNVSLASFVRFVSTVNPVNIAKDIDTKLDVRKSVT